MEDGIPRWLQHCHETCYKKGGCHERQACRIRRWFYCRNVISGQVDLYMTIYQCSQIMTANLDKDPSSCECQLNSTIQRTSRGIEKRKGKTNRGRRS